MLTVTPTSSSKKKTAKKPHSRSLPTSHLTGVHRRACVWKGLCHASRVWSLYGTGGQGPGSSSLFQSEPSWSLAQSHPALLPFSNCRTLWNPYEEAERDPGVDKAQDFLLMSQCSPSSTGNENIKTQVHLLPDLAKLTVCMWGGHIRALHLR